MVNIPNLRNEVLKMANKPLLGEYRHPDDGFGIITEDRVCVEFTDIQIDDNNVVTAEVTFKGNYGDIVQKKFQNGKGRFSVRAYGSLGDISEIITWDADCGL